MLSFFKRHGQSNGNPPRNEGIPRQSRAEAYTEAGFNILSKRQTAILRLHQDTVEIEGQTVYVPRKYTFDREGFNNMLNSKSHERPIDGTDLVREVPQDRGYPRLKF